MEAIFNDFFIKDIKRSDNNIYLTKFSLCNINNKEDIFSLQNQNLFPLNSIWNSNEKSLEISIDFENAEVFNTQYNAVLVYYSLYEKVNNIAFALILEDLSQIPFCQTRNIFTIEFPEDTTASIITDKSELADFLEGPGIEVGANLLRNPDAINQVTSKDSYYRLLRSRESSQLYKDTMWLDEKGRTQYENTIFKVYDESSFIMSVFDSSNFIALDDNVRTKFNVPMEDGTLKVVGSIKYTSYRKSKGVIEKIGEGIDEITGIDGVEIIKKDQLNGFRCDIDNLNHNINYKKPIKIPADIEYYPPTGFFELNLSYVDLDGSVKTITSNTIRLVQGDSFGIFKVINRSTPYFKSYADKGAIYVFDHKIGSTHSFTVKVRSELFKEDLTEFEFEDEELLQSIFDITKEVIQDEKDPLLKYINVTMVTKTQNNEDYWLPAIENEDGEMMSKLMFTKFNVKLGDHVYTETFYMVQHAYVVMMSLYEYVSPQYGFLKKTELVYDSIDKQETRKVAAVVNDTEEEDEYYWKLISCDKDVHIRDVESKKNLEVGSVISSVESLLDGTEYLIDNEFETTDMDDKIQDDLVFVKIKEDEIDNDFSDTWENALKYYFLRVGVRKKGQPARLDILPPDDSKDYDHDGLFKTADMWPKQIGTAYLNIKSNCLFTAKISQTINTNEFDSVTFDNELDTFTLSEDDLDLAKEGNYKLYFRINGWGAHKGWTTIFTIKFSYQDKNIRPYDFDSSNEKYYTAQITYRSDLQTPPDLRLLRVEYEDNDIKAGVPKENVEGLTAIDYFLPNALDENNVSGSVIFTSTTSPLITINRPKESSDKTFISKHSIDVVFETSEDGPVYKYHRLNLTNAAEKPEHEYDLPDYPAKMDSDGLIKVYDKGILQSTPKIELGLFTQHKPVNIKSLESFKDPVTGDSITVNVPGSFYNPNNTTTYLSSSCSNISERVIRGIGSYYRNPLTFEAIPNVCRSSKTYTRTHKSNEDVSGEFERLDQSVISIKELHNDNVDSFFKVDGVFPGRSVYLNTNINKLDVGGYVGNLSLLSEESVYDSVENPEETATTKVTKQEKFYNNGGNKHQLKLESEITDLVYKTTVNGEEVYVTRTDDSYDTTGTLTIEKESTDVVCNAYPLYTKEETTNKVLCYDISDGTVYAKSSSITVGKTEVEKLIDTHLGVALDNYDTDSDDIYLLGEKTGSTGDVLIPRDDVEILRTTPYTKSYVDVPDRTYDEKSCDRVVKYTTNGRYYAYPSSESVIDYDTTGYNIGGDEFDGVYNPLFDEVDNSLVNLGLSSDSGVIYHLEATGENIDVKRTTSSTETKSNLYAYSVTVPGYYTDKIFIMSESVGPGSVCQATEYYSSNVPSTLTWSGQYADSTISGTPYVAVGDNRVGIQGTTIWYRPDGGSGSWTRGGSRNKIDSVTIKQNVTTTTTKSCPIYKFVKYTPYPSVSILLIKYGDDLYKWGFGFGHTGSVYFNDNVPTRVAMSAGTVLSDSNIDKTKTPLFIANTAYYFNPDTTIEGLYEPASDIGAYDQVKAPMYKVDLAKLTGTYVFNYEGDSYITPDLSRQSASEIGDSQETNDLGNGIYSVSDFIFTKADPNKGIKIITKSGGGGSSRAVSSGSGYTIPKDAYPLYKKTAYATYVVGVLTPNGWKVGDMEDRRELIDIEVDSAPQGDKLITSSFRTNSMPEPLPPNEYVIGNEPTGNNFETFGTSSKLIYGYPSWNLTTLASYGSNDRVYKIGDSWYSISSSAIKNSNNIVDKNSSSSTISPITVTPKHSEGFVNAISFSEGDGICYCVGPSAGSFYLKGDTTTTVSTENRSSKYGLYYLKRVDNNQHLTMYNGNYPYIYLMPRSISPSDDKIIIYPTTVPVNYPKYIDSNSWKEYGGNRVYANVDKFSFNNVPGGYLPGGFNLFDYSSNSYSSIVLTGPGIEGEIKVYAQEISSSDYGNGLDSSNCIFETISTTNTGEPIPVDLYSINKYVYSGSDVFKLPDGTYRYSAEHNSSSTFYGVPGQTLEDVVAKEIGTTEVFVESENENAACKVSGDRDHGYYGHIFEDMYFKRTVYIYDYYYTYPSYPLYHKTKSDSYIFEHSGNYYVTDELEKVYTEDDLSTLTTYDSKPSDDGTNEINFNSGIYTWRSPDPSSGLVYISFPPTITTEEYPTYGYTLYSPTKGFTTIYVRDNVSFENLGGVDSGYYIKKDAKETDKFVGTINTSLIGTTSLGNWWNYKAGDVVAPGNVDKFVGWKDGSKVILSILDSYQSKDKTTRVLKNLQTFTEDIIKQYNYYKFHNYSYIFVDENNLIATNILQTKDAYIKNMAFLEDIGKSGFMVGQKPEITVRGNGATYYLIDRVDENSNIFYCFKEAPSTGSKEFFRLDEKGKLTKVGVATLSSSTVGNGNSELVLYTYKYRSKISKMSQLFTELHKNTYTESEILDFTESSNKERSELDYKVALRSTKVGDIRLDNYKDLFGLTGTDGEEHGLIIMPNDQKLKTAELIYEVDSKRFNSLIYNGNSDFMFSLDSRYSNPMSFENWNFDLSKDLLFKFHATVETIDGSTKNSNIATVRQLGATSGIVLNNDVYLEKSGVFELELDSSDSFDFEFFAGAINFTRLNSRGTIGNLVESSYFDNCELIWENYDEFDVSEEDREIVDFEISKDSWSRDAKNAVIRFSENLDTSKDRIFRFLLKSEECELRLVFKQLKKSYYLRPHFEDDDKQSSRISQLYFRSDGLLLDKLYREDENGRLYTKSAPDSIFIHSNVDDLNKSNFSISESSFDDIVKIGPSKIYGEDYSVYEVTGLKRKFLPNSLKMKGSSSSFDIALIYTDDQNNNYKSTIKSYQGYCEVYLFTDKINSDGEYLNSETIRDISREFRVDDIDLPKSIGSETEPIKIVSSVSSVYIKNAGRYPYFIPFFTRREYIWNSDEYRFVYGDLENYTDRYNDLWEIDFDELGTIDSGGLDIITVDGQSDISISSQTYFNKDSFGLTSTNNDNNTVTYLGNSRSLVNQYRVTGEANNHEIIYRTKIPIKIKYICEDEFIRTYTFKFQVYYLKLKRPFIKVGDGMDSIEVYDPSEGVQFKISIQDLNKLNPTIDTINLSAEETKNSFISDINIAKFDNNSYLCNVKFSEDFTLGNSTELIIRSTKQWSENAQYLYTNDEIEDKIIKFTVKTRETK